MPLHKTKAVFLHSDYMDAYTFLTPSESEALHKSISVGYWKYIIVNGIPTEMYADSVMDELVGTDESYTPQQRLQFFVERVYPEDRPVLSRYAAEMNFVETEVEYRYNHPVWGLRLVRCTGIKAREENGIIVQIGKHQDITDRVHLDYETSQEDHILSLLTQRLYGFNITLDIYTGKFTFIKGSSMERVVAAMEKTNDFSECVKLACQHTHPDYVDQLANMLSFENMRANSDKTGFYASMEFPFKYSDMEEYAWHELNMFMEPDGQKKHIVNILGRDITEAHRKADTEAQLQIANAANKSKTQFLFNMSHDIRTPMNAIIGFTNLLEKHLDNKERALDYIKKIQSSNTFLLSLINNVLEMARIESGKAMLDEAPCHIGSFLDMLIAIFDAQMTEKNITFTNSIDVEHDHILCDSTKLREVFLNLLSNAHKYTPEGGNVTIITEELKSDKPGYGLYRTTVRDNGIGMSADYLPHLFEEFSRERTTTESKVKGTGLGMPIVKQLVELMEGTIEVESEVGIGTTFTITIPHRIVDETYEDELHEEAVAFDERTFSGKRILLAEDNDLNAEIATAILLEFGLNVDLAKDGLACVDMLCKAPSGYYDLILMDIQMPNLDGYQATAHIRTLSDETKANIPIIAMTANAFEEDKKNALNAGMNGHLAKPININSLMAELSRALLE